MLEVSTTTTIEQKVNPKIELWSRWRLEREQFKDAKIRDAKTGQWHSWPYQSSDPVGENTWNQFLGKITDPDTGFFYPKRDEDGKPVKTTPDNVPIYKVRTIIRMRRDDGSEVLLSKRDWYGYDALGDPVKKYVPWFECWNKTNFLYEKDYDPKRKQIVKNCKGPSLVEKVYTMPFTEENLKSLFDKRENNYIQFIVKEESTGHPRIVTGGSNINDTYKLFLKDFDYINNGGYLTPEMKAQYRQEAIDAGILSAPAATTATVSSSPPKGTYT